VLFNGKPSETMAKGESVLSDPVVMAIKPLQELAVSIYVPGNTVDSLSTMHAAGIATAYITGNGDATAAVEFPSSETNGSRFLLSDVEIAGTAKHTIVAFGDSITDGVVSTSDANCRWPDFLAARLQADPKLSSIAVANAGIGGNRILHDGFGPSALSRFDRDALEKPGVRWIVLLEGINDVGNSDSAIAVKDKLSAQQIIGGMRTLISRDTPGISRSMAQP
jgi:lysophospholipase L1-like esterase